MNDRNCKDCIRKVLLLTVLYAVWQPIRLSVSKVRQFLHSKDSYTKITLAARKFKRMRAFARFRNEIWCMDLAYVDKLAKENNGVRYLLVRQDLFDRTVNAKGMKTKAHKKL